MLIIFHQETNSMSTAIKLLQNKSKVPSEFDSIARRYDIATWFSNGYMEDLNISASRIPLKGNAILLDLCCGTGKSTLACLNALPNGTITGVDNSIEMLEVAKQKIQNSNVNFLQADAMQLNFEPDTFDVIFMAYGIRNMPDYEKCLAGLNRILKPGGIICFHEYVLNEAWWAKVYWAILGYGFIIPFCTLLTGNFTIFNYLIKSVLKFPSPSNFQKMLTNTGFDQIKFTPLKGWRSPILKTVMAQKAK